MFKELEYGVVLFSLGILMYSGIQIFLLVKQSVKNWAIFNYLKISVNILLLISVVLLTVFQLNEWYYPFVLALVFDFFANILKRIQNT